MEMQTSFHLVKGETERLILILFFSCFHFNRTKRMGCIMDNGHSFAILHPFKSDRPLVPVSFCQVLLVCQLASPPLLCLLRAPGLQVHSLSAHYRWAQERAHISPSSWLIKTFSCSSPSFPPSLPQPHTAAHTTLITPIKL